MDPDGWLLIGDTSPIHFKTGKIRTHNISALSNDSAQDRGKVFYKERWINENGLEQKLIVTYSLKYSIYQQTIRSRQIDRAQKLIDTNPTKMKKANQNDFKRFIERTSITPDGEKAEKEVYNIKQEAIDNEVMYDGFYAVCTNLENTAPEIVKINHRRWEIEENFRIMKSELKARPVYLSRDDRIIAHFSTCFISLMIYRMLEKKLDEKFTCREIIEGLRGMNFMELRGEGYVPAYTRTDFTDALHEAFGFRTDYQVVNKKLMKNILKSTKTAKKVRTF